MTDTGDEADDGPMDAEEAADRLPSAADFDEEFESDDTLDVRSPAEIAEANDVDVEVVREGIEAMAGDEGMTEREEAAIDDRLDEVEDDDRQYSTEEVAEELGIDLDTDDDSLRASRDLMGEPHIDGRRIPVRQIRALVEEGGEEAAVVADRFDLDVADVYHALAYYHDHPREMREVEREREVSRERVERMDNDENLEEADGLIDDRPDGDGEE
ncbi:DUF433 domain-containing protein [Halomicroarcula sp. S1AR25-4]|uniref:DUF433 domain-containing protein n=1 Tax=Haloarcula sp. S1AR25-4 TaxID=2950538 RepID=UPI002874CDE6|nr:DUF433 domain-containing protein [Halomicroarcula sp. S1AR25-4]MDS0277362.1 DUF433 domain-containing protein [Halomicroarcula sp. S1AR25-4]